MTFHLGWGYSPLLTPSSPTQMHTFLSFYNTQSAAKLCILLWLHILCFTTFCFILKLIAYFFLSCLVFFVPILNLTLNCVENYIANHFLFLWRTSFLGWFISRTALQLYSVPVCVLSHFSRVQLFATPWTLARQAPLSMGFSRQKYWSGCHAPLHRIIEISLFLSS